MKKYKYILLTILLLLFPCTTYARCTDEELYYYETHKEQNNVTYKYNTETKRYTLIFERNDPDRFDYIAYIGDEVECEDITNKMAECYNIEPGEYLIKLIGQTTECDEIVESFKINLTEHNKYYKDPLCEGIEEFYLCNPNYEKEIDYETFTERVEVYKKTKQKEEKKEQEEKQKKADEIINYIQDNLITIIVMTAFATAVVATIILMTKSIKKSRRLE